MKPLQSIAMGLVVIAITASFRGYDALPNPLGWLLVIAGVHVLDLPRWRRSQLLALAGVAAAVSTVLWFPSVTDAIFDRDPVDAAALSWAVNLPQLLFSAWLCHVLAAHAKEAGDVKAAGWLSITRTAVVVVGLLPVLVFGGGVDRLEDATYVAAGMVALTLIVMLFTYASRPWASVPNPPPSDPPST